MRRCSTRASGTRSTKRGASSRAGARLRAYHEHAATHTPAQYVIDVVHGSMHDPTLSFQLREGFHVIGVVPHYLADDPESEGYAAIIEWLNPDLVRAEHIADRPTEFLQRQVAAERAAVNPARGRRKRASISAPGSVRDLAAIARS